MTQQIKTPIKIFHNIVKDNLYQILIKIARKMLLKIIAVRIKTVAVAGKDLNQLQMQQGQVGI